MISWIKGKKNIVSLSLLEGMTDIHTHILPGVDDGVRTEEEAIASLQRLSRLGVTQIYLTPHIMSELPLNDKETLSAHYRKLKAVAPAGAEIRLAAEYMLDECFDKHLKDGLLTMNNKHVLVETSYMSPPPGFLDILYEIRINGYQPIIAHPERYTYMMEKDYFELKEAGYKFQLNLFSISGYYGVPVKKKCLFLLKENGYDFVGSDMHSPERYTYGLSRMNLTSSQQKQFQTLLENNRELWM